MSRSKTHHYIPQFVLRNFILDGPGEMLAVYDKSNGNIFKTTPKKIMAENQFHEFESGEFTVSFEDVATLIESTFLTTYQKTIQDRRLTDDAAMKADLACLVAFQFSRTRAARNIYPDMERLMREKVEASGGKMEDVHGWEPLTPNLEKQMFLTSFPENVTALTAALVTKDFFLVDALPGRSFYIGDNPVSLHNERDSGPYGNLGLLSPGIEIYIPLTPKLLLCAWCPSILRDMRQHNADTEAQFSELLGQYRKGYVTTTSFKSIADVILPILKTRQEILDSASTGMLISSSSENMDFYNSIQVASAYRYVICAQLDFELAKRHNKQFPALRTGRRITMG